jgi:hypothetical protein
MGIPAGIASFGIQRWRIFSRGDGGEIFPQRDLGKGTRFYLPPFGNSAPENFIKIACINVYLSIL